MNHEKPQDATPPESDLAYRPLSRDPGSGSRTRLVAVLVLLAVVGAGAAWTLPKILPKSDASAVRSAPVVPVVAAPAVRGDLDLYYVGLGSVEALYTVMLRSRIDGQLDRVVFQEGQLVKQGDLLAEIDPRPFQVQLEQAEGQHIKDQAALKNAKVVLERKRQAKEAVPAADIDEAEAQVAQLTGAVRTDQANIENAKLQLTYCRITAPISGRLGLRLVDPGNMIQANGPRGLAVLTQVQPICVLFYLPQDLLPRILSKMRPEVPLVVEACARDLKTRLATGKLLAVDNQIDSSTGTIRLKAVFDNQDGALYPNQFVNARLRIETRKDVVIVPNAAIQRGPDYAYAYIVKRSDSAGSGKGEPPDPPSDPGGGYKPSSGSKSSPADVTVEVRKVSPGPTEGDQTIVESGVQPGELLVTDGADKLRDGTKVRLREEKSPQ